MRPGRGCKGAGSGITDWRTRNLRRRQFVRRLRQAQMVCNFVARHPTFGSNPLIFNNHERVSAFLSAGARVLVGLKGAIVMVLP
jgi:hypothetical protein